MRALVRPCTRFNVIGLAILNAATFPPDSLPQPPSWHARLRQSRVARVASTWLALQKRMHLNHVLIATEPNSRRILGSVEVHTAAYLRAQGASYLTPEQAAVLQPYLASLAVRDDARGRGIGRTLVEAAVETTQRADRPGKQLMLQVEASNAVAVRVYEKCGFETISAPGCQISVMRKALQPDARPAATGRVFELDPSASRQIQ